MTLTAIVLSLRASVTTSEREADPDLLWLLCYSGKPPELEEERAEAAWLGLSGPVGWLLPLLGVCNLPLTSSDLECLS